MARKRRRRSKKKKKRAKLNAKKRRYAKQLVLQQQAGEPPLKMRRLSDGSGRFVYDEFATNDESGLDSTRQPNRPPSDLPDIDGKLDKMDIRIIARRNRKGDETVKPFTATTKLIQIGHSSKAYIVSDLMLFPFFRKRYSNLWCRFTHVLKANRPDQSKLKANAKSNKSTAKAIPITQQQAEDTGCDADEESDDKENDANHNSNLNTEPIPTKLEIKAMLAAKSTKLKPIIHPIQTSVVSKQEADLTSSSSSSDDEDYDLDVIHPETTAAIADDQHPEHEICRIEVNTFDCKDLDNLIFFMKKGKIPIHMPWSLLSSFLYIADFFTRRVRAIDLERYFERFPDLIPYSRFDEWYKLRVYSNNNKKELKHAVKRYRSKFREVSRAEKRRLITEICNCLKHVCNLSMASSKQEKEGGTLSYDDRRMNERKMVVYWDGYKALHPHLDTDYSRFFEKQLLLHLKATLACYTKIRTISQEKLKCIPFSKLMYVMTDVYCLLYEQKSVFNKWKEVLRPIIDWVVDLAKLFFENNVHTLSWQSNAFDIDEYQCVHDDRGETVLSFCVLYKQFVLHALKNRTLNFKQVLNKLVMPEHVMSYLYEEEEYMVNEFFAQVNLNSAQQCQLAKKLQMCNVNHRAKDLEGRSKWRYGSYIEKALGISNCTGQSMLMKTKA